MPLFYRVKNADGSHTMKEIAVTDDIKPITLPTSPTLESRPKPITCTVPGCGKNFAKPGIFSMHFNRQHKELVKTADSWREYMEAPQKPTPEPANVVTA